MPTVNKEVKRIDKLQIYISTGMKIIRGVFKGLGVKKVFPLFIGKHVDITNKSHISTGKNVKFESYAEVHGLCKYGLQFGNNVTIGRYATIRPSSYYGVGNIGYGLKMGNNSSIGPFGFVGCSGKIVIGNNVMIGPRVSLFAENHNFSDTHSSIKSQGVNNKGITIEDDCWIGSGVIILDGVTIGRGSIIGAGTLVTKDVPAESIIINKRNRVVKSRIK